MTSKLSICIYWPGKVADWARPWLNAIEQGFRRHGLKPILSNYKKANEEPKIKCDLAVFWSYRPIKIMEQQRANRADFLVMERGYIGDRKQWTSLGFNGLNGRADFQLNGSMPGDRWHRYFGDDWLRPWKENGRHILLIGQVVGDASVKNINFRQWLIGMVILIQHYYPGVEIRYRPHPIVLERSPDSVKPIEGTILSTRSLTEDLKDAGCAVTYNSNTGVDAILAGVPTVAVDPGSMVYHLAMHNINEQPIRPDRTQWAYNMAYCQWSSEEIQNGDAWEHLKQRYA